MTEASKTTLPKNFLGHTGIAVSNLAFGTSTFGSQPHEVGRPAADDETAMRLLDRYAEAGGNWLDTADMYSFGESERVVGKWLSGQERERLMVTSKVGTWLDKTDPNALGLSRKHLVAGLENTLEHLKSPYVDFYLLHRWDRVTPIESVIRTLNDFVRCGKIRHFGVSNFSGWQLQKTIDYCKFCGVDEVAVIQSEYNLLCREMEFEVTQVCRESGVSLTPWGALKGGLLNGRVKRGMTAAPEGSRIAWATDRGGRTVTAPSWDSFCERPGVWDTIDALHQVADGKGKSCGQVALRWLLQQDVIPAVVMGARTMEQLETSIDAASGCWSLSSQEMEILDKASDPYLPDTYSVGRRSDAQRVDAKSEGK